MTGDSAVHRPHLRSRSRWPAARCSRRAWASRSSSPRWSTRSGPTPPSSRSLVTDGISDRRQLVAALKLLAAWGVVTETDGTLAGWGERPEDEALLSINRALLIHLLPSPLHQYGDGRGHLVAPGRRAAAPAAAPAAGGEPGGVPGRAARRRAGRAVPGADRAGPAPGRELRAGAGGPGRGRAGLRPGQRAGGSPTWTFPGSGSAKQAALLLLDELSAALQPSAGQQRSWSTARPWPAALAPWTQVDAMLGELATRHRAVWKDRLRRVAGHAAGRGRGPAGRAAAGPARSMSGLAIFPFAARYQPQVPHPPAQHGSGALEEMHQMSQTSVPPRRFDERWRLSRAGIVNVWFYLDNEFDLSGGRMILRGTNGSGKSRALEMLLPFLLDADRRRMDATGAARVSLDELMRTGAQGQSNRIGYLWLELTRPERVPHGRGAGPAQPVRQQHQGLVLHHSPAGRRGPAADVGHAGAAVPGCADRADRGGAHHGFALHAPRPHPHPGVRAARRRGPGPLRRACCSCCTRCGRRMSATASTKGGCRRSCSESLPPLQEDALSRAGEQLDGLTETRLTLSERLEDSAQRGGQVPGVYRRYAAETLRTRARETAGRRRRP